MEIHNLKLLARDEILRRLARMTGPAYQRRPHEITKGDLARYVGVEERRIRLHSALKEPISDMWQIIYSQFFALVDSGELVIQHPGGKKTLVRVPKPSAPPKKKLMPRIDTSGMSPTLRFE